LPGQGSTRFSSMEFIKGKVVFNKFSGQKSGISAMIQMKLQAPVNPEN
jgi:hypothetical protein